MTDEDGYEAIVDVLNATGEFAALRSGLNPADSPGTGQSFPFAWIKPRSFLEKSLGDPEIKARTVRYSVEITVERLSGGNPQTQLNRLINLVQNELDGDALGEPFIPALTTVASGEYRPCTDDATSLTCVLAGEFAYLVSGDSDRDVEPD